MNLLKTFTKTIFFALLLMIMGGQVVHAEAKIYQYDGKLPFIQMMLNMMTVMGILDRLPNNGMYGSSGFSRHSLSPWSRNNNQFNNTASLWGNPSWGVLPTDSYSPYGSQWSGDGLGGWVNESWENSDWNTNADAKNVTQDSPAIVQNFNYESNEADESNIVQKNKPSPLAKHSSRSSPRPPQRKSSKQKPCVTDFCGLKKPNLNGLWLAQNGEMLGVKNHRYLWSDSKSRYLTGLIKIQNEYLLANIDGHDQLMRFKYKLAGNRLLTMQPNGKVREFVRASANQYNNLYRGNGQNSANYYYQ